MKIESITFENFRCFKGKQSISLSPTVNVFVGTNDSGKSSVLAGLRLFCQSYRPNSLEELARDLRSDSDRFQVTLTCSELKESELEGSLRGPFKSIAQTNPDQPVGVNIVVDRNDQQPVLQFIKHGIEPKSQKTWEGLSTRRPDAPVIILESPRFLRRPSGTGVDSTSQLLSTGENCAALVDEIITMPGKQRNEFEALIREVLPIDVGVIPWGNNQKKLGRLTASDLRLDADRMGAGISEVVFLVALSVRHQNKVIVIDEIEQSIHPSVLKKLLQVLTAKSQQNGLQFIITTHSNIVLSFLGGIDGARSFELAHDYKTEITDFRELREAQDRFDVLSRLGYELSDVGLYDSFIITEESSAQAFLEKIILPKCFPIAHAKIKIVASDGVSDVAPRLKILERMHVFQYLNGSYIDRTWVICDGDDVGKETIGKLREQFNRAPDKFLNLEDGKVLEDYYPSEIREAVLRDHGLGSLKDLTSKSKQERRAIKKEMLLRVLAEAGKDIEYFKPDAEGLINLLRTKILSNNSDLGA